MRHEGTKKSQKSHNKIINRYRTVRKNKMKKGNMRYKGLLTPPLRVRGTTLELIPDTHDCASMAQDYHGSYNSVNGDF